MKKIIFAFLLFLTILIVNSFAFTEGYQGATWGMSPEEVKKVFPDKKFQDEDDIFAFQDNILGDDATIIFSFYENQLSGVMVGLRRIPGFDLNEIRSARTHFDKVLEILKEKYGAPQRVNKKANNNQFSTEDMAISSGDGSYLAIWKTTESEITLMLGKLGDFEVALIIRYENPYFTSLQEKAEKEEAIKNKF